MSYVIPSVLVYQQLTSNAGVANVTPDLDTCIIGPCYNVVNYVAGSVADLAKSFATNVGGVPFSIADNTVNNTVYLPTQKPGQLVESSSVQVYINAAKVQTKTGLFSATSGSNILTLPAYSGTGNTTASSTNISTVTGPTNLFPGDNITIASVGPASADLVTTIVSISGSTVTIADAPSFSVTGAAITRQSFNNLNTTSSTLKVEPGDAVVITYSTTVVSTTVLALTGIGNALTGFTTSDVMPSGVASPVTVSIRKSYNNLLLPLSLNSHTNYSLASVVSAQTVLINPLPVVSYGTIVTGEVHTQYRALRTDLAGTVQDLDNVDDQIAVLGSALDTNPLGLGVELALANTIGRIRAIAIASNDLAGYLSALNLAENNRLYAIIPLTQDISILEAVQQHVEQLSTPENASWRTTLVNTVIPAIKYIGQYNPNLVNANGGNNAISNGTGSYVLTSSNSSFISDGVVPGDIVNITASTGTAYTSVQISTVISNTQLGVSTAPNGLTAVSFYVSRNLTRSQQADIVAAESSTFASNRVIHVQPDLAGITINGVVKYLPGYYLCAAMGGLMSGLPAQQGLTNIGLAGISDLAHSNFYFTRAQLKTMAAVGTCLIVQEAAGTIPYIRHSLTTDMTVLQYREIQQVKNFDFLSYYFADKLKGFIGKYNITPDSLQTLRTTINASGKLLQGKVLPKIGPPLLSFTIKTLKQDPDNRDHVIVELPVLIPTVMNYVNLYLLI